MRDTYHRWIHPVVIGSGQRLVRAGADTSVLRLLDGHAFASDVVVLTYQPPPRRDDLSLLRLDDWQPAPERPITQLASAMLGISGYDDDGWSEPA